MTGRDNQGCIVPFGSLGDAPTLDPPGEHEIWPLVGQTIKVKVNRATHSLRVPRELETEDEMWVLVEPVTYEPKE